MPAAGPERFEKPIVCHGYDDTEHRRCSCGSIGPTMADIDEEIRGLVEDAAKGIGFGPPPASRPPAP